MVFASSAVFRSSLAPVCLIGADYSNAIPELVSEGGITCVLVRPWQNVLGTFMSCTPRSARTRSNPLSSRIGNWRLRGWGPYQAVSIFVGKVKISFSSS